MSAKVEVDSFLLEHGFWNQCLWVVIVLLSALVVIPLAPKLIAWHLRPRRKPAGDRPELDTATSGNAPPNNQVAGAPSAPDGVASTARPRTQAGGRAKARPSTTDKRKHTRREGPPMPVLLCSDGDSGTPAQGSVVNRSRGGLGIVVAKSIPRGTIIRVRPVEAPEDVAWVQLEVRNCRYRRNEYYVGCRFLGEPAWNVVLLFG
jgi:hypothetical protein